MSEQPSNRGRALGVMCIPPGIIVLATVLGGIFSPQDGDWMGVALAGLAVATLLSFGIAIWMARTKPTSGGLIGWAILYFLILMVVNLAVSAGGCAIGSNFLPGMTFR